MKNKLINKFTLLKLAVTILSSLPVVVVGTDKLILTTTILPPYQVWNQHNELSGIAVSPVKCALNSMNQPFEFKVRPWKRAQLMVFNNESDGFFIGSENTKRNHYATISDPVLKNQWLWYVVKGKEFKTLKNSKNNNLIVGSVLGTSMMSWLEKNFVNTHSPVDTKDLFSMLKKGRVDAALANKDMFFSTIKSVNRHKYHSIFAQDRPLGVYFSKQYLSDRPGFLNKFNSALKGCSK